MRSLLFVLLMAVGTCCVIAAAPQFKKRRPSPAVARCPITESSPDSVQNTSDATSALQKSHGIPEKSLEYDRFR